MPALFLKTDETDAGDVALCAADFLLKGSLIVLPTDTVYGVAAHPLQPRAVAALYRAKGRDPRKPIPLLAAQVADVEAYGARIAPVERRLIERFWPGPLTLILATGPSDYPVFEGFRIPDSTIARRILQAAGGLLRVSSANASGGPPALTAPEALDALSPFVDLVLDAGPAPGEIPSTVARVTGRRIEVLRQGAVAGEALREAAGFLEGERI